jgi:hypothetical protein
VPDGRLADLAELRRLPRLDVDPRAASRIERCLHEEMRPLRMAALHGVLAATVVAYLSWAIAFTSALVAGVP